MGCASSGPHTGLVNAAQDAAGETEKAAEGAIHGFGDQAKETLTHGVEHVKDAMSSAVTSVEHGLTTAVDTIGDSLGFHNKDKDDSDEKLKNALEVADRTSEAETVEAEDLMDQLLNETKDVSSGVESMTAATMDEAKGEMKKIEDTMTETTSDMQDKMETKMVEIIDASVNQAAEIQEKAEMATKNTLDHIDMMGEKVDTTVTSKIEEMNDMVDETLEVTVDEVNKQVEQIVQKTDGDETKTVGEEAVEPPGTPETDAKTEPEVEEP